MFNSKGRISAILLLTVVLLSTPAIHAQPRSTNRDGGVIDRLVNLVKRIVHPFDEPTFPRP